MGLSIQSTLAISEGLVKKSNEYNFKEQNDVNEEYDASKDDTSRSMPLLILFRCSAAFLEKCGVHDFNIMDLRKPEAQRIRRILSAVINFARFREERMKDCEPIAQVCEEYAEDAKKAEAEMIQLQNEVDTLKHRVAGEEGKDHQSTLAKLNNYNAKLESELKKLQRSQQQLRTEHLQYKERKMVLFNQLEDQSHLINEEVGQVEKYKGFSTVDPDSIRTVLNDLRSSLQTSEQNLHEGEATLRNKVKTIESIQAVEEELRKLLKVVQGIIDDLARLEDERNILGRQMEELDMKKMVSEDLSRQIGIAEVQTVKFENKIEKTREDALQRETMAKEKLESLENEYRRLTDERGVREVQMDKSKAIIAELENEINRANADFEKEKRKVEAAVTRLNAHIRSYLSDMNNFQ